MDGDGVDKVRIEAKTKGIVLIYIRGRGMCKWAWLEYNRKEKPWTYGGINTEEEGQNG